jgi:ribosome-associated protein
MEEHYDEPESISKSQRKRDMLALQALGERLVRLSADQINQLELPSELNNAVLQARNIRQHGALRRQLQYIGRLMRTVDAQIVQNRLEQITNQTTEATALFHRIETWREQLLQDEQNAFAAFVNEHPQTDRQQLRQLIRAAQNERKLDRSTGYFRKLFQFLREAMAASEHP